MLSRSGGPSHPVLERKARNAAPARFSSGGPGTPGHTSSSCGQPGGAELERQLIGQ